MSDRNAAGRSLNAKQARFVEEYLKDLNATQAAMRAGYSEKTAHSQGPRLLDNVVIQAALAKAQAERSKRTKVDADWVLTRLADEATADIADILDDDGAIKPVSKWPLIWRQGLVAGFDIDEMMVDGKKVGHTVKVKLSDRIKRLEMIGKHVNIQAFREQVHNTGEIKLNVTPEDADL